MIKPDVDERYDIKVINQNMDVIDANLKNLSNEISLCAKPSDISLQSLGINVSVTEINYLNGVSSNIQTQLSGKAEINHGTHVNYSSTVPSANGTASAGTSNTVSRGDHVHPLQTSIESATKATQDGDGNVIKSSYASSASLTGNNLIIKSKSGATLSTVDLSGIVPSATNGTMVYYSTSEPTGKNGDIWVE